MSETITLTAPLTRWQGDRGTYHMLVITGEPAQALAMHARLRRLEFGRQRGFGSVKVWAQLGGTRWNSSVFPSRPDGWILLVSKKVMRAENLAEGDDVGLTLDLL